MTHAKFHFNRLMLTLIFGIRVSELPPLSGPSERLKRPGLIGLSKTTPSTGRGARLISLSPGNAYQLKELVTMSCCRRRVAYPFLDQAFSQLLKTKWGGGGGGAKWPIAITSVLQVR